MEGGGGKGKYSSTEEKKGKGSRHLLKKTSPAKSTLERLQPAMNLEKREDD